MEDKKDERPENARMKMPVLHFPHVTFDSAFLILNFSVLSSLLRSPCSLNFDGYFICLIVCITTGVVSAMAVFWFDTVKA